MYQPRGVCFEYHGVVQRQAAEDDLSSPPELATEQHPRQQAVFSVHEVAQRIFQFFQSSFGKEAQIAEIDAQNRRSGAQGDIFGAQDSAVAAESQDAVDLPAGSGVQIVTRDAGRQEVFLLGETEKIHRIFPGQLFQQREDRGLVGKSWIDVDGEVLHYRESLILR